MKTIGKISFWLSLGTLAAAALFIFLSPAFLRQQPIPDDIAIYCIFVLEGLALLLGFISYKTGSGKFGATLSFFVIVALVLYLLFQKPGEPVVSG